MIVITEGIEQGWQNIRKEGKEDEDIAYCTF